MIKTVGDHSIELFQTRLLRENHCAQSRDVRKLVEQNALCRTVVSPRSTGFLVKVLHRFRHAVVYNKSDIYGIEVLTKLSWAKRVFSASRVNEVNDGPDLKEIPQIFTHQLAMSASLGDFFPKVLWTPNLTSVWLIKRFKYPVCRFPCRRQS